MMFKKAAIALSLLLLTGLTGYYFMPEPKLPAHITIDKMIAIKSRRQLLVYAQGKLIKTYAISLGSCPAGKKQFEHDGKTPDGVYFINAKNPNSVCHKNLGISYPNQADVQQAKKFKLPTGGDIKIHGLTNGLGFIGKFHRWYNWTAGCIALTNAEIDDLYSHTPIGTPIEIRL
ncbi:L,D-transpeptidase family protein [Mucilaginibacter paludis]|uniref:ErfK/YbiS/YcfS/YnhG family protein n=1 Tax=Mucilaginibacter paludis DSM 18603 TaxID=714943 RepID=H1Y2Z0_9SPHI|nr:L,D-transpeptidase family protein [Mucilaginibacter paludis]EHQ28535.1 ErfK/YbiS/YcfS/YnhG family protein [Mucilaginibacter paludis DSM 18603]